MTSRMMFPLWSLPAILLLCAGCAETIPTDGDQVVVDDDSRPANQKAGSRRPDVRDAKKKNDDRPEPGSPRRVLLYLKSRDFLLAVHAGDGRTGAVRFSVSAPDGKQVALEISADELQTRFPDLYQSYRTSYADAWAGP